MTTNTTTKTIFDFIDPDFTPTNCQISALEQAALFLESDNEHILVINGYAGTGKTSISKFIFKYMDYLKLSSEAMTFTGKATRVFGNKTGMTCKTIHRGIYDVRENDEMETEFVHKKPTEEKKVFFVDEASLLHCYPDYMPQNSNLEIPGEASKASKPEGSLKAGYYLLNDLTSYANINQSKSKIIFVGDTMQLTMDGKEPMALSAKFWQDLGYQVRYTTLEEVKRTDNEVLNMATAIRKKHQGVTFEYKRENKNVFVSQYIYKEFYEKNPDPRKLEKSIILDYSNKMIAYINEKMRQKYFGRESARPLCYNERLCSYSNNYTMDTEILNGDFFNLISLHEEYKESVTFKLSQAKSNLIRQVIQNGNLPSYVHIQSAPNEIMVDLKYYKATLLTETGQTITAMICGHFLTSPSIEQCPFLNQAYVVHTIKEILKLYKNGEKPNSQELKKMISNHEIFNRLKLKYGYAITCHKAQGSEWENVYIRGMRNNLKNLKWKYTAVTRSSQKVFYTL